MNSDYKSRGPAQTVKWKQSSYESEVYLSLRCPEATY